MAIIILLEMTVPARREPIITSFVLFSNSSDKRFGWPIFFEFWLFPLALNYAFLEFMDVRLNVYFGYCFENLARASLVLWAKAFFPTSIRISFGVCYELRHISQPPYEYRLVYCCNFDEQLTTSSITISNSALFTCSVAVAIISGLGFFFLAAGSSEPVALRLKYALRSVFDDIFIKKVKY